MLEAEPAARAGLRLLFGYSGDLIQAFAKVVVAASAAAIVLWSAAVVRGRALPRWAGIYGLVAGAAAIVVLASGNLRLDAHGFRLVVLGQALLFVAVGAAMCRACMIGFARVSSAHAGRHRGRQAADPDAAVAALPRAPR